MHGYIAFIFAILVGGAINVAHDAATIYRQEEI